MNRWTCIYPIYIDAKRPCGRGERRIARAKSVWWPLSKDIADATNRLGLGTLHEVHKAHPRDWENPGRVRVQWKKDGRFVNPAIKSSTSFFLVPMCIRGRRRPRVCVCGRRCGVWGARGSLGLCAPPGLPSRCAFGTWCCGEG